jgi:plastocyanin
MSVWSTGCSGTGRRNAVRRGGATIAATALAVALVACGSDDNGGTTATTAPAATTGTKAAPASGYGKWSATPTPSAAAGWTSQTAATTVVIEDFAFSPANATFRVGQTVTVTNKDSAPHTWTSSEGGFDTGTLKSGESGTVTLKKAGTFKVVCTFHPSMTGTVTVQG